MKKYLSLGVGIALLISPIFASAQTVSSLQAEVQSLLGKIAALQAQSTASVSGSANASNSQSCINLTFTGSVGNTGSQVSSLQTFLGINPATGYFGTKTKAALTAWQSAHGVSATGYFGALTRAAMACNTTSVSTNAQTITSNNSTQPSATINQSSLTTGSATPVISGTYSNTGAMALAICAGNASLPINSLPNCVFVDHSDHGGSLQTTSTSATSGTFVDNYAPSLASGTYTVGVYTYQNIYTSAGYQGPSGITLLTTGTLTVNASNSTQSSAAINQSSLTTGSANPTLSGTASGVSAIYLGIDMLQTGGGPSYYSGAVPVTNGQWSVTVNPTTFQGDPYTNGGLPAGSYLVQIWSSPELGHTNEIETGNTNFSVNGTVATVPTASVTQTTPNNPGVTLSGSVSNTNSITVVLVPATYSGATDWGTVTSNSPAFQNVTVPVSSSSGIQNWTATFSTNPSDFYPYIYDATSHVLLYHGANHSGEIIIGA